METIKIPTSKINIELSSGETIETSLLDINYVIVTAMETVMNAPAKQKMMAVTAAMREEFGCELTWGEASYLMEIVRGKLSELKKNSSSTQTSPPPTE